MAATPTTAQSVNSVGNSKAQGCRCWAFQVAVVSLSLNKYCSLALGKGDSVRCVGWITHPQRKPVYAEQFRRPGHYVGDPLSQGGSREAGEDDFERSTSILQPLADRAADLGVGISLEVDQHSIIDTAWEAAKLMAMVNRDNVSINPDLGNIYWLYAYPKRPASRPSSRYLPSAKPTGTARI